MRSASSRSTGSRFKGYEDFIVQDLVLRSHVVRIRRERWLTPDGQTILAPMPAGVAGHFGPELRRFVLLQHHQGQVTMPRLVGQLRAIGIVISKRQVGSTRFVEDAVLRAGLETAPWISVDDTGARHRHRYCTQIGNDHFAAFTASKSRLNFLEVLRAGYADYVINAEAYMRQRALAGPVIKALADHPDRHFADEAAWRDHLRRLGITDLEGTPDPVRIATQGALGGAIQAHGLLPDTVILSDDAGQFALEDHALCWVHAERLARHLHRQAVRRPAARARAGLVVLRRSQGLPPQPRPPSAGGAARPLRPDLPPPHRVRHARPPAGTATCQQGRVAESAGSSPGAAAHQRLRARSAAHVIKRKISGGTRSDQGRECRDAFLGLLLTCAKLGVSFWDFLGHRLGVAQADAPYLPDLVRLRSAPLSARTFAPGTQIGSFILRLTTH